MNNRCESDCYPRVLVVVKSKINSTDSTGVSIRNWFYDWPNENIGQIYSGGVCGEGESSFIKREFQLGVSERRLGRFFFALKGSSLSLSAMPYKQSKSESKGLKRLIKPLLTKLGKWLINTGLWELLFPPQISPELRRWIMAFKPDVIFVQGGDISFMRLPVLIKKEFGIPICFNVVDDWVRHLYKGTVFSPILQPIVAKEFWHLMVESDLRYVIGFMMASEYESRYGFQFKTLMQCADPSRYPTRQFKEQMDFKSIRIVYSGSLALKRWQGILDLSLAVKALTIRGLNISIDVYSPFVPDDAVQLCSAFAVKLHNALPDSDMPALLASADILFLPESFDDEFREYIKFSISTKAHLYMMSGQVTLVYGPLEVCTINYAKRDGWAYVVDEPKTELLEQAVYQILANADLRYSLIEKAEKVSKNNHVDKTVRKQVKEDICMLAFKGK